VVTGSKSFDSPEPLSDTLPEATGEELAEESTEALAVGLVLGDVPPSGSVAWLQPARSRAKAAVDAVIMYLVFMVFMLSTVLA